ncbi:MAG: hypothetical protein LJE88_01145 [Deltaproteobacteria bacterium]|nr:hypothetical protein [Deltaproteobacteria bacterium]
MSVPYLKQAPYQNEGQAKIKGEKRLFGQMHAGRLAKSSDLATLSGNLWRL